MRLNHWSLWVATGGGLGLLPHAPGTWGSIGAIFVYLLLCWLPWWAYSVIFTALLLLGTAATAQAGQRLPEHDDSRIVIDEILGMLLTLVWLPQTAAGLASGLILFRVFDILKPFPIRTIDRRLHNAWGVMLDDLLAGLFAAVAGLLLWRLLL